MDHSQATVPYEYDQQIPSGQEAGAYTFFLNDNITIPVLSNATYPNVLTIASPSQGSTVDATNGINFTWNNLGANYAYLVTANTPEDNNNNYAIYWASQDIRNFSQDNPASFQTVINNGLKTNSVTIPASVFASGDNVQVMVAAIDTTQLSYTAGTASVPYGHYHSSYPSAVCHSPSNNR